MRYAVIAFFFILSFISLSYSLSSNAAQQTIDKAPLAVSIDENPVLELQIIEFLVSLSNAYKKGDPDGYLSFYSASAIENGLNSLEKIKARYLTDMADNTITGYEFDIYEIKNIGRYSVIDGAYNKAFANKITGEGYNTSGDVRIKVLREQGFKIETIDYDRYIRNEYVIGPEDILEISVWKSPDLSTATIARPGKYLLRSETRILQAISLAGGLTPGANKDNIIILRKTLTNPEGKRIRIKYSDIISGKNPEANILVRSGDTILLQPY